MLKRFLCKHEWKGIIPASIWTVAVYGCNKCGKVVEVKYPDNKVWRFKQKHKGATFDE